MNNKLHDAMEQISDTFIADAAVPKKHHNARWLGAVAALLAIVLLSALTFPALRPSSSPNVTTTPILQNPTEATVNTSATTGTVAPAPTFDQVATAVLPASSSSHTQNYDGKTRQALAAITEALLADNAGTNPVCSPLNVYVALAALAETTDGSSRSQILHALGENDLYALRAEAQRIWEDHYANKTYQTLLATSLWIDTDLSYDQSTANALAEYYYSSVYYGDLNADAMERALKDWLDQQTGGLLHDHIQSISLPSDTMLILASTIYYRAQWLSSYQFSKGNNTQGIFHTSNGVVTTTFMNDTLTGHPIFTGENFTATYIPLDDGSSMWFILPDVGVDPRSVVNGMNQSPTSENVWIHFSVPKFDITGNQDLSQSLKALGIIDVFGPNAEFSIIPGSDAALGANHVARVTIDEKGVEAAAYVLGTIAPTAPAPTKEVDFVLDRPFAFNIVSSSGISLFAGVVNNPTA